MRRANQKLAGKRERRGLRNRDNYKSFLENKEAYLEDLKERIAKLTALARNEYVGEAVILACCYLDALGYFRYLPCAYQSRETCTKFMIHYAADKDLTRVSLLILLRIMNSTQDSHANALLAWLNACEAKGKRLSSAKTILRKFARDFPKPAPLINAVKEATLANVFYDNVRSLGVHQGRFLISHRRSIEVGGISIDGPRVLRWLNVSFQNVLPYLRRRHRWIRAGKYA